MKHNLKVSLSLICILFFLAIPVLAQESSAPKVLVLHSYHKSLSWVESIEKGIIWEFKKKKSNAVFRFEYMDTKRINRPDYLQSLFELYKIKFENIRFNIIICSDNNALNFLLSHHHVLFFDTPIVFCGINNFKDDILTGQDLFTGTVEEVDFRLTLDIAVKLHPKTRQIIFYGDDSPTYHHNKALLDKIIPEYENRLKFQYKNNFNLKQIQNDIQTLDSNSLILLGSTIKSETGEFLSFEESVKKMETVSRVPIYGCWDFFLGHGLAGGRLISGFAQGKTAANIALRILDGKAVADIPVIKKSPNQYMFDNDQLIKFNIDPSMLPKDAVIINRQIFFYVKNKKMIVSIIGSIAGLTFIILMLSLNIRARKRFEQELEKSRERYRLLVDNQTDMIVKFNPKGQLQFVSPSYCKTFGKTQKELIGQTFMPLIHEDDQDKVKKAIESVFNPPYIVHVEERALTKDGWRWQAWLNTAILNQDNKVETIIAVGRDVTEKVLSEKEVKKLQEQVLQSQKMESIGTLAGGIAHDFNNILFPILGHTEMLIEDIPEDSPFKNSLDEIYTSVMRARELVKQILTFSRQKSGEFKFIKMQPIVKEALKLIRSTIPTTIKIKQDINADCGAIKADPTQIHQIIMNLATNACHAMEDGSGELKVSLQEVEFGKYDVISLDMEHGIYACLTISDTGTGMTKDVTRKIFDPFFTTKEQGKGTGMGLSVVHGIVKSMRGVIHVYSEPDSGTQFNIYLPVIKTSLEEQSSQIKELILKGSERILLVDDEDIIITMEKQMLKRLGYHITSHNSSIQALEVFQAASDKFDLIITDMAMPDMPGDKLAVELIKIRADIPILLCTGFSETMSEEKAASLGIKGFLMKPIIMKDLAQKIREVLDEKKG